MTLHLASTSMSHPERLVFALALESLPGVGKVTVGRVLDHFDTLPDLRSYPREQVLLRLKGTPRLDALVDRLFDSGDMDAAFAQARAQLEDLDRRQVQVLVPGLPGWPHGLDDLPRSVRPARLSAFGHVSLLGERPVGFLARPPISDGAFERAQGILRRLLNGGVRPASGIAHGFDVVIHKIAVDADRPAPSLMVCGCGLAQVDRSSRPLIRQCVGSGGLLVSPFPLRHGPFDHDDRDRALVLAALSSVVLFFEPRPDTPEWEALTWSLDAGRPVFGIHHPEAELPERVHRIESDVDVEWIEAAVQAAAQGAGS